MGNELEVDWPYLSGFCNFQQPLELRRHRLLISRFQVRVLGGSLLYNASSRVPYLYPDLDDDTSEAEENVAIEARTINATGFRYVGILALEGEHFHTR